MFTVTVVKGSIIRSHCCDVQICQGVGYTHQVLVLCTQMLVHQISSQQIFLFLQKRLFYFTIASIITQLLSKNGKTRNRVFFVQKVGQREEEKRAENVIELVVLLLASRDCCAGIQNLLQISKGLFTLRAETQNGRIQLLLLSLSLSLLVCLYARSLGLNIPRYICFSTYIRMYIVEHWSMSILLKYLCLIYRSLCADQRVFMYRPRYTFE